MDSVFGAVLAGGKSRRLGTDKAFLEIEGQPLWRRQERLLRRAGIARIALVRRPGQAAPEGAACLRDRYADAGPLAGLEAAFAAAREPWIAVVAVDMPRLAPRWFEWLRGFCGPGAGAIARHADAFEPLAAIYPREAGSLCASLITRRELSLQSLASGLSAGGRMRVLPVSAADRAALESVNTPPAAAAFEPGRTATV